ncbi:MAG: hypothetical protein AAGC74_13495, partial [Verrucomicrobiota bacterium]
WTESPQSKTLTIHGENLLGEKKELMFESRNWIGVQRGLRTPLSRVDVQSKLELSEDGQWKIVAPMDQKIASIEKLDHLIAEIGSGNPNVGKVLAEVGNDAGSLSDELANSRERLATSLVLGGKYLDRELAAKMKQKSEPIDGWMHWGSLNGEEVPSSWASTPADFGHFDQPEDWQIRLNRESFELAKRQQAEDFNSALLARIEVYSKLGRPEVQLADEDEVRLLREILEILNQLAFRGEASESGEKSGLEAKGNYGSLRQHSSEEYREILKKVQLVGRVSHRSNGNLGTAFLLNGRYCLTAWHVVENHVLTTGGSSVHFPAAHKKGKGYLRIHFDERDYEDGDVKKAGHRVVYAERLKLKGVALDIGFLKISPAIEKGVVVDGVEKWTELGEGFLFAEDYVPTESNPLYVPGYPLDWTDMARVADQGFVYLPHELSEREYRELRNYESLMRLVELHRGGSLLDLAGLSKLLKKATSDTKDQLEGRYVRDKSRGRYLYSASYRKGYAEQPLFGLQSSTYKGNSGSPVVDKKSGDVVGLFVAGAGDFDSSWEEQYYPRATPWFHEVAIPVEVVRKALLGSKFVRRLKEMGRLLPPALDS